MNQTVNPTDSSLLLWLLAAVVAMLAAYVAQSWVLLARRGPTVLSQWRAVLVAACTLGTGICSSMLLATSAQGLLFPIGYQVWPTVGIFVGSMLASVPLIAWLAGAQRGWLLLASGPALAALASAVQFGWLWAAGFRPGIIWRQDFAAAALITMTVGLGAAAWLSFSDIFRDSSRHVIWRVSAAALLGLTLAGGQELLIFAAGLIYQQGSIYQNRVPGTVLSLVAGVLVPLVLVTMAIDLLMRRPRRRHRRDGSEQFNPQKRRKRRHRIRTL